MVDRCLAVSSALAKKMAELVPGLSVEVVGNVVDTDYFKPLPSYSKKGFTFLIASRLDHNKRVGDAIRAFSDAFATEKDTYLWVCGRGPEEKKLHALVADLNITRQVTFLESGGRDRLLDYYSRADVIISTSRRETFGLTLLEAMACGKPVIATRSGGPEEFIIPQVGMLVDGGDIKALSTAMRRIIQNIDNFNSHSIRDYAVSNYSSAQIASHLLKIYQEIMR